MLSSTSFVLSGFIYCGSYSSGLFSPFLEAACIRGEIDFGSPASKGIPTKKEERRVSFTFPLLSRIEEGLSYAWWRECPMQRQNNKAPRYFSPQADSSSSWKSETKNRALMTSGNSTYFPFRRTFPSGAPCAGWRACPAPPCCSCPASWCSTPGSCTRPQHWPRSPPGPPSYSSPPRQWSPGECRNDERRFDGSIVVYSFYCCVLHTSSSWFHIHMPDAIREYP